MLDLLSKRLYVSIFITALILRLVFCFVAVPVFDLGLGPTERGFYIYTDGYTDLAVSLAEEGRFAFSPFDRPTTYRAPLFPAAVAIMYSFIPHIGTALMLVNCLVSAGNAVVAAMIIRCLVPRPPLVVSFAAAFLPLSIYYCTSSFSDTMVAFTVSLYVLALAHMATHPGWKTGAASGVAFAAATLTKGIFLPFPAALLGYAALRMRRLLPAAGISAMVGLGLIGVWTIRNAMVSGRFIPVSGGFGFNLLVGNHMIDEPRDAAASFNYASARAVEELARSMPGQVSPGELRPGLHLDVPHAYDQACGRIAVRDMLRDPLLVPRKIIINIARFWYFSSSPAKGVASALLNYPLLVFAVVGFLDLRDARRPVREVLVLFFAFFVLIYAAIIVHTTRFALPLLMIMAPLAAHAVYTRLVAPRLVAAAEPA